MQRGISYGSVFVCLFVCLSVCLSVYDVIRLISSRLLCSHFNLIERAVIGRSHGKLERFTARDIVRRNCNELQRTHSDEMG